MTCTCYPVIQAKRVGVYTRHLYSVSYGICLWTNSVLRCKERYDTNNGTGQINALTQVRQVGCWHWTTTQTSCLHCKEVIFSSLHRMRLGRLSTSCICLPKSCASLSAPIDWSLHWFIPFPNLLRRSVWRAALCGQKTPFLTPAQNQDTDQGSIET